MSNLIGPESMYTHVNHAARLVNT